MSDKSFPIPLSVVNFGCRLNSYEGEVMKQILVEEKIENVIIVNTCAVTKEAERQARQTIRKLKRKNADVKIMVTGCAAQINPQQFQKMPEVYSIVGNAHKLDKNILVQNLIDIPLTESGNKNSQKESSENSSGIIHSPFISHTSIDNEWISSEVKLSSYEERTRAFVQIQNGCRHRCTFCIIPYGRGQSRSIPAAKVIEEVTALYNNGYNEIVLTGVDMTDYGFGMENPIGLGALCKMILKEVPCLQRLRLSSIDVAEIDDDLLDLIKFEKRMMPYLHISLQSGDNLILKRMKRRHNREDVLEFCAEVRKYRPEIGFGSDIIAGFPTETEEMFNNTALLLKDANIVYNHIFSYSERYETPASRMPQVEKAVRKYRTRQLIEQTRLQARDFYSGMVNSRQNVIMESDGIGRCENFAPVKLINSEALGKIKIKELQGKIIPLLIERNDDNYLYATFNE